MAAKEYTYHYKNRNPAWLCAAKEVDGKDGRELIFSQPEIVLYDDDPMIRMSYPDHFEKDSKHYLVEAQKHRARIHMISSHLLDCLFRQFTICETAKQALAAEYGFDRDMPVDHTVEMPLLPLFCVRNYTGAERNRLDLRQGFSIELLLDNRVPEQNTILLDSTTEDGRGIQITRQDETLKIQIHDGQTMALWCSTPGMLSNGPYIHTVIIVDGGPKIISFVTDGQFDDGGDVRQFGWGRFSPMLENVNARDHAVIGSSVLGLRIYQRALLTSEAIGNYRASMVAINAGAGLK